MVDKPVSYPYYKGSSWSEAWSNTNFKRKAFGAAIVFAVLMLLLPYFFSIIEARQGFALNDWFLQAIPSQDCSITIFVFLWSTSLLIIIRSIQRPAFFLRVVYLLISITVIRMVSISLVPLEPPPD